MRSQPVRLRPGAVWIAGLGILGLLTAWAIQRAVSHPVPLRPVYVAAHTLAAGTVLAPGDVARRLMPAALTPPGAVGPPPAAAPVWGWPLTTALYAGQVLVRRDSGAAADGAGPTGGSGPGAKRRKR